MNIKSVFILVASPLVKTLLLVSFGEIKIDLSLKKKKKKKIPSISLPNLPEMQISLEGEGLDC